MAMLPVQAPSEEGPVTTLRPRRPAGMHRGLASRSDERLVAIAKDGDERAFEILYERHSLAILRYCRSLLRSAQEAEDVKQEAFVLAISALRRGAEPEAFRPWLYRVAHNACMSHLRVRRPVLVADNGVLVGPAGAAAPVDTHREELRQLLDDIGTLPEVQRGALLLREMDGFSYEQVGEVLGLPLSTVRASIFRARRTLQGLADARDADCEEIQSELSRLADRRGRRGRHITSHLHVCANCREFRDGLRRRPTVLGAITPASPFGPGGLLVALKAKLVGGAAGGGASAALVTGGGGAGVAKIAAVAASSIALLAGAGIEADHVIEHGRREAAVTPRQMSATPAAEAARGRATAAPAGAAAGTPPVFGTDRPRRAGRVVVVRTPRGASSGADAARPHARETARESPSAGAEHGSARATPPATGAAPAPSGAAGERHHGGTPGSGTHDDARGEDHAGARHADDASEHAAGGDTDDADRGRGHERTTPAGGSAAGPSGVGSNGAAKPADGTSHAPAPSSGGSGAPATTPTPPAPAPAPAPQAGPAPSGSAGSGSGSGSTPAPAPPSNSGPGSAPDDPAVGGSAVDPAPAPADPAPAAPAAPAGAA
jgi:RNA polymerase sigma factor (sigma-70 family)